MAQTDQVYETVKNADKPLTSADIKTLTDLTAKQVSQALSALKLRGLIVPEREIDLTKKAYNRYKDKPQRWAINKEMFDE